MKFIFYFNLAALVIMSLAAKPRFIDEKLERGMTEIDDESNAVPFTRVIVEIAKGKERGGGGGFRDRDGGYGGGRDYDRGGYGRGGYRNNRAPFNRRQFSQNNFSKSYDYKVNRPFQHQLINNHYNRQKFCPHPDFTTVNRFGTYYG